MRDLLERFPPPEPAIGPWFRQISEALLREAALSVGGQRHTILEVEVYYRTPDHPDPFVHGDDHQRSVLRWYLHRTGGGLRSGTFKGIDLTFGRDAIGGILIRTLKTPEGKVINGSSLCVDHILRRLGLSGVAALDAAIADQDADNPDNPLRLVERPAQSEPIWATARVGLTLKRVAQYPSMEQYLLRPYRFLSDPRAVRKGRVYLIMALHQQGHPPHQIREITGSPRRTIEKYIDAFAQGAKVSDGKRWHGRTLDAVAICQLHGVGRSG
ncbi:MAG: hypothetical protein AAFV53_32400 [Myxococcota bacterium]